MFAFAMLLVSVLAFACSPAMQVAADTHTDRPVQLWQDASIFDAVKSVMTTARSHVWVEMYEFGRHDLAETLVAQRRSGLDVRVIVDPSVGVSRAAAQLLGLGGVPVRFYPIDDARHQIDHVKLLLTEAQGLVGGMNWGAQSYRNHDYALELKTRDMVARLTSIFLQDWTLAGNGAAPLPLDLASAISQTAPGQEIRHRLDSALSGAQHLVEVEVFVLTDAQVMAELVDACRRHVSVKILLDPNQDVNLPGYVLLRAAGVSVRWYPIPPGAKLHAKAGVFDSTLVLGSANWSLSGLSVNHELDVETTDGAAVSAFRARFDADWSYAGSGVLR